MFAFLISWILCQGLVWQVSCRDPVFTCPKFVEEGLDLVCNCTAPTDVAAASPSPVLTWEGQSVTPQAQLSVNNVSREQNGTQYTCEMSVGNVTTTSVYTLQVAYGPDNGSVTITGDTPFITNGTGTLTLTCLASGVNPAPSYDWPGMNCGGGSVTSAGSTCSFKPSRSDDGKKVICVATSPHVFSGNAPIKSQSSIFSVELLYPPSSAPVVTSLDGDTFLRNGDVINCTVSSGKPRVSVVNFYCTRPALRDQSDVIVGSSVISPLRVNTSTSTSPTMSCLCSATWQPGEELYTLTTSSFPRVEYKASIVNFTLNQDLTSLTVSENDVKNVNLSCFANGLPKPNITLSKIGADTGGGIVQMVPEKTSAQVTLSGMTCEKTGVYVCTVYNKLTKKPDQSFVRLNVLCAPKADRMPVDLGTALKSAPVLSKERGVVFSVNANPTPDNFTYSIFDISTDANNVTSVSRLATGLQLKGRISTECTALVDKTYNATCVVRPLVMTRGDIGVYGVTASNLLGSYDFYFKVDAETISSLKTGLPALDGGADDEMNVAAVAGGIAGGVALIIVIVVVVLCLTAGRRKESRDARFEERTNEAFVNSDALDHPGTPSTFMGSNGAIRYEDISEHDDAVTKPRLSVNPALANPDFSSASGEYLNSPQVVAPSALKSSQKKRPSKVSFKLDTTTIGQSDTYYVSDDDDVRGTPRRREGSDHDDDNNSKAHSDIVNNSFDEDYAVLGDDPAGRSTVPGVSHAPPDSFDDHYTVIDPSNAASSSTDDDTMEVEGRAGAEGDVSTRATAGSSYFFPGVKSDYAVVDDVSRDGTIDGRKGDHCLSGDYAEIGKVTIPRQQNSPAPVVPLYAAANSVVGPDRYATNGTSSDVDGLSSESIRGPLGDIYRRVSRPNSKNTDSAVSSDKPTILPSAITLLPQRDDFDTDVQPRNSSVYSSGMLGGFGSAQTSPLGKDVTANGVNGIHGNHHHGNNVRDSRPLSGGVRGRVASFEELSRDGKDAQQRERKAPWDSNLQDGDVYDDAASSRPPRAPVKTTEL